MITRIKVYGKEQNRIALGIVKAFLELHPKADLSSLASHFPVRIDNDCSKIIFMTENDIKSQRAQSAFFTKKDEWLIMPDGERVGLMSPWSKNSFDELVKFAKKEGIEAIESDEPTGTYRLEWVKQDYEKNAKLQDLESEFKSFQKMEACIKKAEEDMFSGYNPKGYLNFITKGYDARCKDGKYVYHTLRLWGLDRISPYEEQYFLKYYNDVKVYMDNLSRCKLEDFNGNSGKIIENLEKIFLYVRPSTNNSRLVYDSKALHLFLPDLIIPMDRKYTITALKKTHQLGDVKKELDIFIAYHKMMAKIYKSHKNELDKMHRETGYPITKLLDHAVIGFELLKKK